MANKFECIEILDNNAWNKTLGIIDSFYINYALVSVYNKKGAQFISIPKSLQKMYSDVYSEKIKIPEVVDDGWVNVTLARYVEKDVKSFEEEKSPVGEIDNFDFVKKILNLLSKSEVMVNYQGLMLNLQLAQVEELNASFDVNIISTLRGKLASNIKLKGKEINFNGIIAPSRNLQRHEVLTLKIFIDIYYNDRKLKIILSKIGENFSKIFIDDGIHSNEYEFKDFNINWGSFDINRGI